MSPFSSSDSRPPSRGRESDMVTFVTRWTLTKESHSTSRRDGNGAYLSGVTVGRGFFVSFIIVGSGVDATGVVGTDISSERRALPPRASKSSACFVFFVPSFIPDPLNVGARNEEGTGDTVLAGGEPSNRCETGA